MGNPANYVSPVVLRPYFAISLPFSFSCFLFSTKVTLLNSLTYLNSFNILLMYFMSHKKCDFPDSNYSVVSLNSEKKMLHPSNS